MGKDFGSWVHQQCPPHEAPNLNCTTFVPNSAWRNVSPDDSKPTHLVSNEFASGYARNGLSQVKTGMSNGPSDWFYGLPRYRQALTPIPNCAPKQLNVYPDGCKGNAALGAVPRTSEKKFVVFDRSGNLTRLMYGPGTAYSTQGNNVATSGAVDHCRFDELRTKGGSLCDGHICSDDFDATRESQAGEESEMHEDTEELNALLYSDDDEEFGCECGCEEEVSTGHSPSKVIARNHMIDENAIEEVASSGESHLKRKRSPFGECNMPALMDTASSGKPNGSWECECEDDAESSCGESTTHGGGDSGSSPLKKRMKKDKIRETVKILQSIIPCGKGKDAMYVLDEAIQYLKSLKLKAQSLGESLD